MADLEQFSVRIRDIGKQLPQRVSTLRRKTALVVDRELVMSTAVDTGRARSNWVVQVGQPSREELPPYVPGESGSSSTANAQGAISQARAELSLDPGDKDIYISNNLPYIQRLNTGWSAQSPAGFVQRAVQLGLQWLRRQRIISGN